MIITDLLISNAKNYGDEVALVEVNPEKQETRRITWREYNLVEAENTASRLELTWNEFNMQANRVCSLLNNLGAKKGTKVGVLLMNCIEWLPIYFGILKAGCIAVPLNYRYTANEILYCTELADIELLFFGEEFIGRVEEIVEKLQDVSHLLYVGDGCPHFAESYATLVSTCDASEPTITLTEEDYGAIYFSSGTTGFPKAILHKHRSLIHSCRVEQSHHKQGRDDVFLCIPPLYHTGAKMHWFGSLLAGSKAVLLKGTKPKTIIETISNERCTIVWLLVPWAQDILDAIDRGDINVNEYNLSQWRLMHIGAQPVPPSLIKRWKEVFPHHQYDTNYGLSESIGPGCVHLGIENEDKVGAIGKAGYGWQTKIVDENRVEVKRGEVGELAVFGPGVMTCYYKDVKATNEVLSSDGWLFTGDMAKEDEDGFIYLVDRKKDVIIMGGENIYPVQIEDYLRANDKIKDVAVIGIPDARLGEVTCAIIELKEENSCTEEDIREFCKELPRYKRPNKIIFSKVPRNPTGKIEKPKLREKYCGISLVKAQLES